MAIVEGVRTPFVKANTILGRVGAVELGRLAGRLSARSEMRKRGPGANAMADSMVFSSSRTLPGQSDAISNSSARSSIPSIREFSSAYLRRK